MGIKDMRWPTVPLRTSLPPSGLALTLTEIRTTPRRRRPPLHLYRSRDHDIRGAHKLGHGIAPRARARLGRPYSRVPRAAGARGRGARGAGRRVQWRLGACNYRAGRGRLLCELVVPDSNARLTTPGRRVRPQVWRLQVDLPDDVSFIARFAELTLRELRGRQPLSIISKQLLSPWAALLAQDRSVSLGGSSPPPAAAVSAIISDPGVARALRRVTGAGPPRPATSAPATPPRARSPSPQRARSPVRTPPRAASPQATPLPPPPSAARAGAAPLVRAGSPTPVARRKAYDLAAGIFPSSDAAPSSDADEEVYDDETSMLPPAQRPPSQSRSPMPSSPAAPSPTQLATPRPSARPAPPLLLRSSPPAPPTFLPTSEADFRLPSEADFRLPSDADYTAPPSSTADPLIPTLPNKKKKKKDPKKIEEEEEAAANKRREEMKKRMAAGGGGRLGRRRA